MTRAVVAGVVLLFCCSCNSIPTSTPGEADGSPANGVVYRDTVYIVDNDGRLGTVNIKTGSARVIGDTRVALEDIAFDRSGALYGVSLTHLYSINPLTAAAQILGRHEVGGAKALETGPDRLLYIMARSQLLTIDPGNLTTNVVGDAWPRSPYGDLAVGPDAIYMSDYVTVMVRLHLSPTFRAEYVGPLESVAHVDGLSFGSDGVLYGSSWMSLYSINTQYGVATRVHDWSGQGLGPVKGQATAPAR